MKEIGLQEVKKADFKDLESYLKKNDLLDEKCIWFAGFDDRSNGANHAVAANLFYGNKRMIVICVKGNTIYQLQNSKKGFRVLELGNLIEKFKINIRRNIVYPVIEINSPDTHFSKILVTKNKKAIYTFKKVLKSAKK